MRVKARIIGLSRPIPGFERQEEIPIEFAGESFMDLLLQVCHGMDPAMGVFFLDGQGGIPADLTVNINGRAVTDSNRANLRLKEGDRVEMISSPG